MAQATETTTKVAVANPAPLALAGFASTTLVLSAANSGFTGVTVGGALTLALFFGGLAQVIVGIFEFRNANTFGGIAFTGYGLFWLSFWAFFSIGPDTAALVTGKYNVAWYLIIWTVFTLILTIGTLKTNIGLILLFVLLLITFLLLTIGAFNGDAAGSGLTAVGGYFGIATAVVAFYMCAAGVFAAVDGPKLPVGPRS
jgi:succinate-acetate transporter protein